MPAFPSTFDLAGLDGSNGFHLVGSSVGSSAAVGDVDGDGFDDLAIKSSGQDIIWLGQRGPFAPSTAVTNAFPFEVSVIGPPALNGYESWSLVDYWSRIAGLGDINGDGFADFDHHVNFMTEIATEYSCGYGCSDSWTLEFFYDYAEIQYGAVSHAVAGERFGGGGAEASRAAVGDVNGDGFDDVFVGWVDSTRWIVFGSTTGIPDTLPRLVFTGASAWEITGAGDVNGDGIDDLVVETSDGGGSDAYIVYGRTDLAPGTVDLTALEGTDGFKLSEAMDARAIGDVNGDGFDDIVVASWGRANNDPYYVVYGRADSPAVIDPTAVDGSDGFRINNAGTRSVSSAGDINADGLGDFIIGEYVVFGRADVGPEGLDAASVDGDNGFQIVATGIDTGGWSIQAAGDVNGDGVDDLVVGTPNEDTGHIVLGHAATAVNWLGTSARENHGGSPENDVLNGAGGNDYLRGLGGDDLLIGGSGGDMLDGGDGNDTVGFGATVNGATVDLAAGTSVGTGLGNDTLISIENAIGGAGADNLSGTDGDNRLDGGLGADRMVGRLGNDTYVVDDTGDVVVENHGGGTDTVETTLGTYVLGRYFESLVYTGTANFTGTGNAQADLIVGGDGDDTLNGGVSYNGTGLPHDTLRGGLGDDTYILGYRDDDVVEEAADAGYDTVVLGPSRFSYMMGDSIEAVESRGPLGDHYVMGNALDNVIVGSSVSPYVYNPHGFQSAHDELNGGAGDDQLFGRGDSDILRGGTGNDLLDGGTGDDFMRGSEGDDTYVVDTLGDVVTESHGDGYDTVRSAVSFTLSGGFESLIITTSQSADGAGNSLANYIQGGRGANFLSGLTGDDKLVGGAGNDVLDGGGGADWMQGGTGNDTYWVNDAGDIVDEGTLPGSPPGGGRDGVWSWLQNYTLGATIEDLNLEGTRNNTATGNALNNRIVGQGGDNRLTGLGGADILTGGNGRDTYVFGAGFGRDTITDFAEVGINDHDTIRFEDGLFADYADVMAHATQTGDDVLIAYDVSNRITLSNMLLANLTADDFLLG